MACAITGDHCHAVGRDRAETGHRERTRGRSAGKRAIPVDIVPGSATSTTSRSRPFERK